MSRRALTFRCLKRNWPRCEQPLHSAKAQRLAQSGGYLLEDRDKLTESLFPPMIDAMLEPIIDDLPEEKKAETREAFVHNINIGVHHYGSVKDACLG